MRGLLKKLRQSDGAALITVLMLVAVMSVGLVFSMEALGFTIKRATAVKMHDQARLYALGGEELARMAAEKLYATKNRAKVLTGKDKELAVAYPIEDGEINGLLRDVSNCFNVNSLVKGTEQGMRAANEETALQYKRLLTTLGFSEIEAEQLTATLTDWLDSDSRPIAMGAEDYDYSALTPPYRAANSLMVDKTELRLVKGYGPDMLALIGRYLCVRPTMGTAVLNANSLKVEDAPLLIALVGDGLALDEAQRLIAERPSVGYGDSAAFWSEKIFEDMTLGQEIRTRVEAKPQAFEATIRVQYLDAVTSLTSSLVMQADGTSRVTGRQYGMMQ